SGKKCSVGDIVLQDGTTVNPTSYKEDSRNPAIGVIAFFKDENYTGSSDVGSQRGNVEDAVILGIKRDIKPLIVPEKKATFYRDDNDSSDDMLSYIPIYDVLQDRQEHSLIFGGKYYENSYIDDGANNYAIIKAAIDETVATNPDFKQFGKISYPAFEVAENYGVTNNIKGTFRTGWFIPTDKESSFLEGNKTTINYALSKIKGADTFATSEDYVANVYNGENQYGTRCIRSSTPFGSDNNFLTSNTGRRFYDFVWNAGLVYCIRNYADIDAAYSGRPVNAIASGTYGEKPQANAVGDIVFSDGSATALRSNLILTKEQKKAVMAVGVYIGDGYIGEDGYLYVASVYRKNSVSIINDELGQIKNAEKVPSIPVNEYNTLILQYGSLPETPHFYPFTGTINDGNKIWETIKNAYSWATGEKDRSGNYIKGFLPFIYADSYGSGNMFIYEIKKGSAYNPDAWNIAATKQYGSYAVTTPKLGSNYSSGWFIPSYAENAMALSSIGKFRELFRVITESDVGSCYSNRSLYFNTLTSGLQLQDSWETMSPDVVFHKASKVYNDDLSLSPDAYGPERCYIGDVVLMDGSFVRNELYEPNPKNPAVGIVAFFKDKYGNNSYNLMRVYQSSENSDFTGPKKDAVILGIKSFDGTWQEANAFASNYGTKNGITGIYRKGWYIPSVDDTMNMLEDILSRCLSTIGFTVDDAETGSFDSTNKSFRIWTTTEKADEIVFGYNNNNVSSNAYTWKKNEVHATRVLHDYVEPVTFVATEELVTDRNNPYKVGDIVLQDGSIVSASSYKANARNPAIGVIAFFKDAKFPNAGDYGSRTGTKENAYIIGVNQKRGVISWASSGAQGLSMQKELQTYPSMMGLGAANTATFYPGSDNDGSDNWQKLCAAVSDENRSGRYPAFEFAASYGKTAGITGTYSSGWYVPTLAELAYVYRNKRLINESIELIDMTMCIGGAVYITSSQLSFEGEGTYVVNGFNGNIELEGKYNLGFGGHGVVVIRPLSMAVKTPEQWKEPVVQSKTAENAALKPSSGTLIGKKPYPDAIGDIIFSDGSATAFTNNLYLTKKEKKEAVAVAAFIGDGKIGEKGKIYGLSLSSSGKCGYYDSSSRFLNISSWCTGFGKNMIWSASEIFDGPRINGCYPNGKIIGENEDQYYKVSYFTGDVDGSDNWDALCKSDPYGALNAESIYPAWNFVKNLGDGWYLASTAELWMIDKNRVLINNARLATGYEAFDGSWSSSFTGNEAYPACTAGNGGFGDHQYGTYYEDEAYGLYAFDMCRNIFGNAAY
nr:hypothetical protein [Treponemataceae bacterium]